MHLQCYQRALDLNQIGNAVSALKEISILKGYRIEQTHTIQTTADLDQADDKTLLALIFDGEAPVAFAVGSHREAIRMLASQRKRSVVTIDAAAEPAPLADEENEDA
jgi:hypothetical protein